MPRLIAVDGQGTLSEGGANTNPLFANARVGDTGTLTIKMDEIGFEYGALVECSQALALSADGNFTGRAGGESLDLGTQGFTGDTLHIKCVAVSAERQYIRLPLGATAVGTGITVNADAIGATAVLPAPTVVVNGNAIVNASALGLTATLPAPTITVATSITVAADALGVTATLPAPTITAQAATVNASGLIVEYQAAKAYNGGANSNADATNRSKFEDLVGALDGTVTSAAWTATSGWAGAGTDGDPYSLNLSATTDDYINIYHNAALNRTATTTIEMWVKFGTTIATQTNAVTVMLCKGEGMVGAGATNYGIYTYKASGYNDLRAFMDEQNVPGEVSSGGTLAAAQLAGLDDGNWHHLVVVLIPGSACKFYVDGVIKTTDTTGWVIGGTPAVNSDPLAVFCQIGTDNTPMNHWHGSLTALRLYNDELTAGEVSTNYAAGKRASAG